MDKNSGAEPEWARRERIKEEKAQQAREREERRRDRKAAARVRRKNARESFANIFSKIGEFFTGLVQGMKKHFIVIVTTFLFLCAIFCGVTMLTGFVVFTELNLLLLKIGFYGGIGVLVLCIACGFFSILQSGRAGKYGLAVNVTGAVLLLAMGIATLSLGMLGIRSFYYDSENGVAYAERSDHYEAYRFADLETATVSDRVNGILVQNVHNKAGKNKRNIKTVVFRNTDLSVGDNAFENCVRLETVRFEGEGSYTFGNSVFMGCTALMTFDVGDATVEGSGDGMIFGESTYATVTVKDGSFSCNSRLAGVRVTGNDASVTLYAMPQKAEFEDGFDFGAGSFTVTQLSGFWNDQRTPMPFASEIYLPSSISSIPANFFGNGGSSCIVRYAGSRTDWDLRVSIDPVGNSNLKNGAVKLFFAS